MGRSTVAALCWLCWILHGRFPGQSLNLIYSFGLVIVVGLVSWTGYRGGQLTQGDNHLTEHMPEDLRDWLGLPVEAKVPALRAVLRFSVRVEPVFAAHCTTCHGPSKRKSHLRLDTYEGVMRGGKGGLVIKVGSRRLANCFIGSPCLRATTNSCPRKASDRCAGDELKLIELWIAAGASATLTADAIKDAPAETTPAVAEVSIEEIDPASVVKLRAPLAATVILLQKRYPDSLEYESRGSADSCSTFRSWVPSLATGI